MRIKKDTILKVNTLSATQHLTNEEYGALIRYIQIQDDKDGYRYESLQGIFLSAFQKWEKELSEDFEKKVLINPSILSAYSNIFKQVSHSRQKFEELQKRYDEEDEAKEEQQKPKKSKKAKTIQKDYMTDTFDIELEDGTAIIFNATYDRETLENIPSKIELTEFLKELGEATADEQAEILQRIERQGMLDHWKRHWKEYIEERSIFDD